MTFFKLWKALTIILEGWAVMTIFSKLNFMCKICGFNNLREKCNKPKILAQMMSHVVSCWGEICSNYIWISPLKRVSVSSSFIYISKICGFVSGQQSGDPQTWVEPLRGRDAALLLTLQGHVNTNTSAHSWRRKLIWVKYLKTKVESLMAD